MEGSKVYIAGIGTSQFTATKTLKNRDDCFDLALTASAKALLDAGITYTNVSHSVACLLDDDIRVPRALFDAFGLTGASTSEVDGHSALLSTIHAVESGRADCALLVGFDTDSSSQTIVIALVLVSATFMASHAFLKDAAVAIRAMAVGNPIYSREKGGIDDVRSTKQVLNAALEAAGLKATEIQILDIRPKGNDSLRYVFGDSRQTNMKRSSKSLSGFSGSLGLAGLAEIVWELRGWAGSPSVSQAKNALQITAHPARTSSAIILGRADGKAVPEWKSVEHRRDGRERLFHNPAVENSRISLEDWQAVKADDAYLPKDAEKKLRLRSRGGDRAQLARLQPRPEAKSKL